MVNVIKIQQMKWHKQWINSFKCASNDSMGICKNVFYVAQCFLLNFHFIFVNINFFCCCFGFCLVSELKL